jgi:hypothetical protein
MKILSDLNQKHILIGGESPRIYHRHLSEVRDLFRASVHFTPGIGGWGDSHGRSACSRQDKELFRFQGIEKRLPGRLIPSIVTILTELYRLPDFTRKSAYARLA